MSFIALKWENGFVNIRKTKNKRFKKNCRKSKDKRLQSDWSLQRHKFFQNIKSGCENIKWHGCCKSLKYFGFSQCCSLHSVKVLNNPTCLRNSPLLYMIFFVSVPIWAIIKRSTATHNKAIFSVQIKRKIPSK